MSIDIDWTTLTSGDDGAALAESIRAFIHERFQNVTLPRFIRSVKVHSFDFGTVAPELELKDVCDPLPDFYDDDEDDEDEGSDDQQDEGPIQQIDDKGRSAMPPPPRHPIPKSDPGGRPSLNMAALTSLQQAQIQQDPMQSKASTPGIPGGTANFSYFHMQPLSSAGLSGMRSGQSTPLSAVTPHHFGGAGHWASSLHQNQQSHASQPASAGPIHHQHERQASPRTPPSPPHFQNEQTQTRSENDIQTIFHLRYAGDLSLSLTADILLDYPTTSFVSIPLQLNVTGLSFDGVAVLAYIRRKAHFCFLAPEDADALVGGTDSSSHGEVDGEEGSDGKRKGVGGLFDSIRVESEIGQRAGGKQSLKNIGKVEAFVLEQVRRLFDGELVYPSFWTFLV